MIKASGCILYHIKENLFNAISAEEAWNSIQLPAVLQRSTLG